jgi:ABC-type anion transport system duplicated permease subunit
MIFIDYGVIAFTIRKITTTVNQSTSLSKKANNHILRVLIILASIPLIGCIPITLILIKEWFSIEALLVSGFSSYFGIGYAFFKCFAMILVVPAYRQAFLQPFTFNFWRQLEKVQEVKTVDRPVSSKHADL